MTDGARRPFRILGKPMPVVEDRRFVRGKGRYINDLGFPGMLHMAVMPAPVAHARLQSVDTSAAQKIPGVVAVLTGADLPAWMEPIPQELDIPDVVWYPLATDKIRYVGEWVAAVVATSRAIAEDALDVIGLDYEELDPVVDPALAMQSDAPLLHEAHGSNVVWEETFDWGDVDGAFDATQNVFEFDFRWHRHSGVPLETFGVVARVDPTGTVEIWSSHQNPGVQQEFMRVLRLSTARVHMDIDLGGSYGSKRGRKHMFLTAIAAMATRRPVKFIEDRIENMQAGDGHGPDRIYRVRAAASDDGIIDALDINVVDDLGAYCGRGPRQITKPTGAIVGPYAIVHVRYGGHGVLTCKTNQQPFRGAGQSPHNFVLERTMDLVARKLDIDRLEIRRRNYIPSDRFPYSIPGGAVYDSGDYAGAAAMAEEKASLEALRDMQAKSRAEGRLVGIGIAGAIEPSGGASESGETLRLQVDQRGKVVATIGFQSAGQAHESMVTQIICEELGVEPADVVVERGHGLSGLIAGAPVGSRMTLMLGTATKRACDKVVAKMKVIVAHVFGATEDEIVLGDARLFVEGSSDRGMDLDEVARVAYGPRRHCPPGLEPGLTETAVFSGPDVVIARPAGVEAKSFPSYAFDFHIPVIEIDPETFAISFLSYVVVHDCGTVLNPLVVDGFVYGGIGHGIGGALYERFEYDEVGQMLSASFMDYLMPSAAEVPRVDLFAMETPSPLHPYGAKGAAEGAYMTAPAAIASAIEDALEPLSGTITEIPITPQMLFEIATGAAQS